MHLDVLTAKILGIPRLLKLLFPTPGYTCRKVPTTRLGGLNFRYMQVSQHSNTTIALPSTLPSLWDCEE